jgi:hypothetical protein
MRKFLQNTAQLFLKTVLKVAFLDDFYYAQIWIRAFYIYKDTAYVFADLGKFKIHKSQKRLGLKTENPQRTTFVEGQKI